MMKKLLFGLICLLFIILTIGWLSKVGVHYDEVFWINAARGGLTNDFIFKRFGHHAVMIMSYIGALKPTIFFYIFKFFGVSIFSIRLPNIFLWLSTLYLFWRTYSRTEKHKSITVLLMLVFNPALMFLSLTDFGPVLLDFFIRILIYILVFKFVTNKRGDILISVLLFLGIYNKLNFIWFVNALFGTIVVNDVALTNINKTAIKIKLLKLIRLFLLPYILFFIIFFKFNAVEKVTTGSLIPHFQFTFSETAKMLIGTNLYEFLTFKTLYVPYLQLILGLIIIFSLITVYKSLRIKKINELTINVLFFFFILLQIGLTVKAGASWHLYMLFPYIYVILSEFFMLIFRSKLSLYMLVGVIIGTNVYLGIKVNNDSIGNIYWSKSMYDLINYTKSSNNHFMSVDWGINNQILGFDYKNDKYFDYWPFFCSNKLAEAELNWLHKAYFNNKNNRYIEIEAPKGTAVCHDSFKKIVINMGFKLSEVQKIPTDTPVFRIYRIDK